MNLDDILFSQKWLTNTPRNGCSAYRCCGFLICRDCLITVRTASSFDLSFGLKVFKSSGRSYSRQTLGVTLSEEDALCFWSIHVLKYSWNANTVSPLWDWMKSLIAILVSSCLNIPLEAYSNTALNFLRISSLRRDCWLDCICSKRVFWPEGSAYIYNTSFLIGCSGSSLSVDINRRLKRAYAF